ncbi:MAG: HD domain-containing protein [Candidatus Eremiobacterota bacterium]
MNSTIIKKVHKIVIDKMKSSAHDYHHVMRVYHNCMLISNKEQGIDLNVLKLACLLHDIARNEEDVCEDRSIDHAILGSDLSFALLTELGLEHKCVIQVCEAIRTHRFRGNNIPTTMEAKILFDGDKLDILGAIGIARLYMFSGEHGQLLFNDIDIDKYVDLNLLGKTKNGRVLQVKLHSPNLEYILKISDIPDKLFTNTAKELAQKRIAFMDNFFQVLQLELGGHI